MGDHADDAAGIAAEAWGGPGMYKPGVACRHCGSRSVRWRQIEINHVRAWRLHDADGQMHDCPKFIRTKAGV